MQGNNDERVHHLPPQGQRPGTDAFDVPAEQLERIIARASVLQHAAGDSEQRQLSEQEIIGIGQEVGLAPEHVRRALSEYRADALMPPPPEEHPLLTRLLGHGHARVRRVVRGDAPAVHAEFEHHLRRDERMRPVRLRGNESVWEPDGSWASKLTRALDLEGRGYELAQLKSVNIVTAPASEQETLVTLTADLGEERRELLHGWGIATPIVLVVLTVTGVLSWWLTVLAAIVAAIVFPVWMRRALDGKRRRAALLMEGLLDQLELRLGRR
ncbi:MAG: hypothetical protein ACNA7J_06875 [Wenzhouxiangella sp.]